MANSKGQEAAEPRSLPDGPLSDVASIHEAEEALAKTLSEVDRTEEELRAAEEVVARLQAELGGRLSEAERLTSLVAQAYELQRQRLERELQQIQARARQLQRAREPRALEEPPAPVAPEPVAAPEPVTAPATAPTPTAPTPTPATAPAPAPSAAGPKPAAPPKPAPEPAPAAAADGKAPRKPAPAPEPAPASGEGGEAYEDHWYQVLKRSGLGAEEEPSDAAAGR